MVNDNEVAEGANTDRNFETTSASAIIRLTAGDYVWVNLKKGTVMGHPAFYTTFSGYRIGPGVDGVQNVPHHSNHGFQNSKI